MSQRPPKNSKKPKKLREVKKWQIVENVAAALERYYHGDMKAEVIQKAMVPTDHRPEYRREVDVLVKVPIGPRTYSIGIDVKNEKRPLTIEMIEQLDSKRRKLAKNIDRYCILSTSGFSSEALEEMRRIGIQNLTLEDISFEKNPDGWELGQIKFKPDWDKIRLEFDPKTHREQKTLFEEHFSKETSPLHFEIEYPDGTREAIRSLIEGFIAYIDSEQLQHFLEDEEGCIDFNSYERSFLIIGDSRLPAPTRIKFTMMHRPVEFSKLATFRFQSVFGKFDETIETGIIENGGHQQQVTWISHKNPDGSEFVQASISPATPSRTNI